MLEYWKDISLSLVCCKINSRVAETVCEMFQKNWAWPWIRVWRFASLNALSFFREKEISCLYDAYLWGFILKINSFRIYFYLSDIGWRTIKNKIKEYFCRFFCHIFCHIIVNNRRGLCDISVKLLSVPFELICLFVILFDL